ncbi:MAG: glycosyltransferase [Lachnospiraceae bacterium]|nr:glycosyltransferase [Lachnospiraceae bacterium]
MKLLSIAVPCYNSAAYMKKSIASLLTGGERVEVIIVDDGSTKDNTWEIAQEYERQYPGIVKAVHQENGGHGEAVNTGLANATGLYFKVVDSDDHLDPKGLQDALDKLEEFSFKSNALDMMICNYVYDKEGARHKKVMAYRTALPMNCVFDWNRIRHFHAGQYILMHSVIYRTQLLKDCGLRLPAHTFYVDNLYVYYPLPYVKRVYYMNIKLYRYYIGRADQSVNEKIMIGRIDQQIRVTKMMLSSHDLMKVQPVKLRKYMMSYFEIMMAISSILAIRSGSEENLEKRDELWNYLKDKDKAVYRKLRYRPFGRISNARHKVDLKVTDTIYRIVRRIYGFN